MELVLSGTSGAPVRTKIAVGTITRNRPRMLENLLRSYAEMHLPDDADVDFIIVENNAEATLAGVVEDFRLQVHGHRVTYLVEPVLGIASARNRVLESAIEQGYDLLTFADDDEQVDQHWLVELLLVQRAQDLDLLGSPARLAPVDDSCTFWQKLVWDAAKEALLNLERRNANICAQGHGDSIKLATWSWMGRLDFFRRTGLRFDASLGFAGGEDTRLYLQAKALGARTGWAPKAIVYETVPATRLSFRYRYRRIRDQACEDFKDRFGESPSRATLRLLGSVLSRIYKTVLTILTIPFHRHHALWKITFLVASLVGYTKGWLGFRSKHYLTPHGH